MKSDPILIEDICGFECTKCESRNEVPITCRECESSYCLRCVEEEVQMNHGCMVCDIEFETTELVFLNETEKGSPQLKIVGDENLDCSFKFDRLLEGSKISDFDEANDEAYENLSFMQDEFNLSFLENNLANDEAYQDLSFTHDESNVDFLEKKGSSHSSPESILKNSENFNFNELDIEYDLSEEVGRGFKNKDLDKLDGLHKYRKGIRSRNSLLNRRRRKYQEKLELESNYRNENSYLKRIRLTEPEDWSLEQAESSLTHEELNFMQEDSSPDYEHVNLEHNVKEERLNPTLGPSQADFNTILSCSESDFPKLSGSMEDFSSKTNTPAKPKATQQLNSASLSKQLPTQNDVNLLVPPTTERKAGEESQSSSPLPGVSQSPPENMVFSQALSGLFSQSQRVHKDKSPEHPVCISVALAGFTAKEQDLLVKKVTKLVKLGIVNQFYDDNFGNVVSHLVVAKATLSRREFKGKVLCKRTTKVLQGQAAGSYILTEDWIKSILKANKFVAEETYLFDGTTQYSPDGYQLLPSYHPFLKGYQIYFQTENPRLYADLVTQLTYIVQELGGMVTTKPPPTTTRHRRNLPQADVPIYDLYQSYEGFPYLHLDPQSYDYSQLPTCTTATFQLKGRGVSNLREYKKTDNTLAFPHPYSLVIEVELGERPKRLHTSTTLAWFSDCISANHILPIFSS